MSSEEVSSILEIDIIDLFYLPYYRKLTLHEINANC